MKKNEIIIHLFIHYLHILFKKICHVFLNNIKQSKFKFIKILLK